MTGELFVAGVAALAALLTALGTYFRPAGDQTWFKRWVEAKEHAQTDSERELINERISHYILEMAVADKSRSDRIAALIGGTVIVVIGFVVIGASQIWPGDAWFAWVLLAIGVLLYVLGISVWVNSPDRIRAATRKAILGEVPDKPRGIWRLFRRSDPQEEPLTAPPSPVE